MCVPTTPADTRMFQPREAPCSPPYSRGASTTRVMVQKLSMKMVRCALIKSPLDGNPAEYRTHLCSSTQALRHPEHLVEDGNELDGLVAPVPLVLDESAAVPAKSHPQRVVG